MLETGAGAVEEAGGVLDLVCARHADVLEGVEDVLHLPAGWMGSGTGEEGRQGLGILEGLREALAGVRERRMGGITDNDGRLACPAWQRLTVTHQAQVQRRCQAVGRREG